MRPYLGVFRFSKSSRVAPRSDSDKCGGIPGVPCIPCIPCIPGIAGVPCIPCIPCIPGIAGVLGVLGDLRPYCPRAAYLASVASLAGRHHCSLSRYHAMVSRRPSAKSVCLGRQPSSRRSFVESMA